MTKIDNFKDLTIRWREHPKYKPRKILEDEILEVIVQKLEMILYTGKKQIFGQEAETFGIDLERYLWQTTVSSDLIKTEIERQIILWVPELPIIGYSINIDLYEGTYRDIMNINFLIKGQNIDFLFK